MTPQENDIDDWEFEALQTRYEETRQLDLTLEQAKLVYEYEQQLEILSDDTDFSMWEEFDFELASFQEILTTDQFEKYKIRREEIIRLNETQLAKQDQDYLNQLTAAEDLLSYYKKELLPNLEKQRTILLQALIQDREKIEYLKAEYKKYFDIKKKFILVNHFRHSKTLQPNLLKLSLLNHQLTCLLPDYYSFRAKMDSPTKVIAEYLEDKIKRAANMIYDRFKEIFESFEKFKHDNRVKHLGEIKGWHVTIETTEQQVRETQIMEVVLMDTDKYGCQQKYLQ